MSAGKRLAVTGRGRHSHRSRPTGGTRREALAREFRHIAATTTILRCQVGSGVHGTGLDGQEGRAADSFLGYLRRQRERLVTHGGTKNAMHMVRIGVQGVELLETGRITLPVPEPWRTWLRAVRRGERTTDEALEAAASLEARLCTLARTSSLPPEPDHKAVDAWLVDAYTRRWLSP